MVCSVDRGRLAAAIRLYTTGKLPKLTPDEVSREMLSIRSIYDELRDSDEPNFLNEEDMHVFGSRPLIEPLQLVSCNACKKPVKASQFAKHSERCRLEESMEDTGLGSHGGDGNQKPPRKERKKVQSCHGDDVKSEPVAGNNKTAVLESKAGNRTRKVSIINCETREVIPPGGRLLHVNKSKTTPLDTHYDSGVMPAVEEHNYVSGTEPCMQSGCIKATACFDTKKSEVNHNDRVTCASAIPLPLATKRYHFPRNCLRNAIRHIYRQDLMKDHGPVTSSLVQSAKSAKCLLPERQNVDVRRKIGGHALFFPCNFVALQDGVPKKNIFVPVF